MLSNLTSEQFHAVTFLPKSSLVRKNLVIEAGAGAGKTKVLSERVKWLLSDAPQSMRLNSNQIFLVTFTNDAQKELKERIHSILGTENLKHHRHALHISTIDSLFDSLVDSLFPLWWDELQTKNSNFQMPPVLSLITETDVMRKLEKRVSAFLNEYPANHDLTLIIDFFLSGGFKKKHASIATPANTLENILKCMCQDSFLSTPQNKIRIAANKIHPATLLLIYKIHNLAREEYNSRIQNGLFTYADKTVFLNENLKDRCPIFIKELIVDEYQDTNLLQHIILSQLVENSKGRMVVVGDPKQSIYGFRGASVNVFQSLLSNPLWEHIVLKTNFRTDENLLKQINTLSRLSFEWKNPRHPEPYKESLFYEEALKKYIGENPLLPGKVNNPEYNLKSPVVHLITASSSSKNKSKESSSIKINEMAPYAFGLFLQEFKDNENFSWNDIVVLTETNKQIHILKEAFLNLNIPLKIESAKDFSTHEYFEDTVSLALLKCLAGKQDNLDLYIVFLSPLVQIPMEEIYDYFSAKKNISHNIKCFFIELEKQKSFAKENFFLAWQKFRWSLALLKNDCAKVFCANMDLFSQSILSECQNALTRMNLETAIDHPEMEFSMPLEVKMYSINHTNELIKKEEKDALQLKTIHKAKGLEWPVVCFYPKHGMHAQSGEFISALSQETIDISWLNEDKEGLSVVERVNNSHFLSQDSFTNENQKTFRYAELRKEQEESYERQRVFYTALTRPKQKLILFQPTSHHSSKKGLKELCQEKKQPEYRDYLEQDVFTKYLKLNFILPEKSTSNQNEKLLSACEMTHLTHYDLEELKLEMEQKFILAPKNQSFIKSTINENNLENWMHNEAKIENEFSTINTNESQNFTKFKDIKLQFEKQKIQREKVHKGVLYHSKIENKQVSPKSLLFPLQKYSQTFKRELEIWSKNGQSTSRNILDALLILNNNSFKTILDKWGITETKWADKLNKHDYIALVVDFKTGEKKSDHVDQIFHYMNLVTPLMQEQFQIFDSEKNIPIFGAILYSKSNSSEYLYYNNEIITPLIHKNQETFFLFSI